MPRLKNFDEKYDLILPVRVFTDQQKQQLEEMFQNYYEAVRNTAMCFAVSLIYHGPLYCHEHSAASRVSKYLHRNYPNLGSTKVFQSATMRVLHARNQMVRPILRRIRKLSPSCSRIRRMVRELEMPDDLYLDCPYRYIAFKIDDAYSDKVHLPFRCSLTNRTISVINDQVLSVPAFTPKTLVQHAELLPDGASPKTLSICRIVDSKNPRYEVRISFMENKTTDEFKRSYKGTVRMIYQQWLKTTRKGGQNGKRI